jgi:hypothetical protein
LLEALAATGDFVQARLVAGAIVKEILEKASHLRDPETKRTFLEEVEENARAIALYGKLANTPLA